MRDHLPILFLCVVPFAIAGARSGWTVLLADALCTFLALCFAYSVNDLFDSAIEGEDNAVGEFAARNGAPLAAFLAFLPAILAVLAGALLLLPGPAFVSLLAILLIFLAYSAPPLASGTAS